MPSDHDPVARALRAFLLSTEGGEQSDAGSRLALVETSPQTSSNAVVRVLRIPWCEGHLEWKLLQDLAAPFEDAFDVVFDDPDFAPDFPPPEDAPATGADAADADLADADAASTPPSAAAAVALIAWLLCRYRAHQFELLAALPDERLQLELALLAPLMDAEEEEKAAAEEAARTRGGGRGKRQPPPPPRLQFHLAKRRRAGAGVPGSSSSAPAARACFSVPLEGVKRASLGPLADYLGAPRAGGGGLPGAAADAAEGEANAAASDDDDAPIQGLALRASFGVCGAAGALSSPSAQDRNLRLSLAAPAWLRRAGLPPMALPPLPGGGGGGGGLAPPLADYASDAAARLSAHLSAQAPRAAKRYALVDALAAAVGAAPLEVAPAPVGGAELATAPVGADGGGQRGGWSAAVSRSVAPAAPSTPALTALFALLLDGQPLLLSVEIGARFPDEQPLLRVTRALGAAGGDSGSSSNNKRKAGAAAELAATGETKVTGYPWSPRWPADEAAARMYNSLAAALAAPA